MSGASYEIQYYRDGNWKIQAFFDDKELALLEARRMSESKRYTAVRVVEEIYDSAIDDVRQKVIYRASEVDKHNEAVRHEQKELQEEVLEARRKRHEQREQDRKPRRPQWLAANSMFMLALKGIAIVCLGGALIYALNVIGN